MKINDRFTREARRESATARDAARQARTPQEQVAALDARLGAGNGAQKERARLTTQNRPLQ